jgi:epsilon-lactone hydrolase
MTQSITSRAVAFILRTTGVARKSFTGGDVLHSNIAQNRAKPTPQPGAKWHRQLHIDQMEFQGRTVWHLAPKNEKPAAHILFWHGGGYVYPATSLHFDFLAHMAKTHGWAITVPMYPLSPEYDAAMIREWVMSFYQDYSGKSAGAFFMGGDSAGGGMASAAAMMARSSGFPQSAALFDQAKIEPRDAILTISGIRDAGALYAGQEDVASPWVSPQFGDWNGLPPILVFGGGDDILVTDARALKSKQPSIIYVEGAKMIHDWPLFFFPESRKAQSQMAAFVKQHL